MGLPDRVHCGSPGSADHRSYQRIGCCLYTDPATLLTLSSGAVQETLQGAEVVKAEGRLCRRVEGGRWISSTLVLGFVSDAMSFMKLIAFEMKSRTNFDDVHPAPTLLLHVSSVSSRQLAVRALQVHPTGLGNCADDRSCQGIGCCLHMRTAILLGTAYCCCNESHQIFLSPRACRLSPL